LRHLESIPVADQAQGFSIFQMLFQLLTKSVGAK